MSNIHTVIQLSANICIPMVSASVLLQLTYKQFCEKNNPELGTEKRFEKVIQDGCASYYRIFNSHSEIIQVHLRNLHSLICLKKICFTLYWFKGMVCTFFFAVSCTVWNNLLPHTQTHCVVCNRLKIFYSSAVTKVIGWGQTPQHLTSFCSITFSNRKCDHL